MKEIADPGALDHSTKLAFERTWLAEERTIQAWVRTAASLISFGFAIYSFFVIPTGPGHGLYPHRGPAIFSIALVVVGLVALLGAVLQRRQAIKYMETQYGHIARFSIGEMIAALLGATGLLGLALLITLN